MRLEPNLLIRFTELQLLEGPAAARLADAEVASRMPEPQGPRTGDRSGGCVGFGPLERPRPLPYRVADEILGTILADGLRPGDQLPSERELAAQLGVSRTVIREGVRTSRSSAPDHESPAARQTPRGPPRGVCGASPGARSARFSAI